MEIKDRIKSLRKHAKLSQEELAEKSLVTRVAVTHWESGKNTPNGENLINLAVALNTSPEYILYGIGLMQLPSQTEPEPSESEELTKNCSQHTTFFLPSGQSIAVWVDEKGQLQVWATSQDAQLAVLPVTQGALVIKDVR